MFYYIVGILLLLILLFFIGYLFKRKHYRQIDQLEKWKITIMNRPVTEELAKIKQLNMTGEAEQLFERWRQQWDEIIMVQLPDVEEHFLDVEYFVDKYRFNKATESQEKIAEKLQRADDKIDGIIEELSNLIGSEEKNRTEINRLENYYREARRSLLARSHSFGNAAANLETELDETVNLFEKFEQKTAEGNYLAAREVVMQITDALSEIKIKMELIPQLIVECETTIPALLKQLTDGYQEMVQTGYILTHIQMERELERLNNELTTYLQFIEKTELADVEKGLIDIKESIELLFDLLEKEVRAKHYISQNEKKLSEKLAIAEQQDEKLGKETEVVQEAYHLSEADLHTYEKLTEQLDELIKKHTTFANKLSKDDTAYSELEKDFQSITEFVDKIIAEQTKLFKLLETLREDEINAREKISQLRKSLTETIRRVERSNLPGLPRDYEYLFQDAQTSLHTVMTSLQETPLNMKVINKNLATAIDFVEKLVTETDEIITDVNYVEVVIQYGNRYRSSYPILAEQLAEAEILFHNYDYKEALERAVAAIEAVEPGALKRIEQIVNEQ